MKKIEAIVRPEKLEDIKEALNNINVSGITVYQVMGYGQQKGWKEFFRGTEMTLNMLPKIKFEIIVADDEAAEKVIDTIREAAYTGQVGDGKIFAYDLTHAVRIRTNERGPKAI